MTKNQMPNTKECPRTEEAKKYLRNKTKLPKIVVERHTSGHECGKAMRSPGFLARAVNSIATSRGEEAFLLGGATVVKKAPIKRRAKWSRRDIEHGCADVMRKGYGAGFEGQGRFPGLFVISLHSGCDAGQPWINAGAPIPDYPALLQQNFGITVQLKDLSMGGSASVLHRSIRISGGRAVSVFRAL
jgi:hypothetical protein